MTLKRCIFIHITRTINSVTILYVNETQVRRKVLRMGGEVIENLLKNWGEGWLCQWFGKVGLLGRGGGLGGVRN